MEKTKRSLYLDNIAGILIIHMIFFVHLPCFCKLINELPFQILGDLFSFFMAWFFFKSGMFYKTQTFKIQRVLKDTKKLLVPFVFFNLVGAFVHLYLTRGGWTFFSFFKYVISELYTHESVPLSLSLWFLLSLFIVRNFFMILNVKLTAKIIAFFSMISAFSLYYKCYCIGGVCSNIPFLKNISIPYYVGNIFLGLFFFCCGVVFKNNNMNLKKIYIILLLYIVHFFYRANIDFRSNFLVVGQNYVLAIVYMLIGILLINFVFKFYLDKKYIFLTYIGEKSILFYVLHFTFGKVMVVWFMENFNLQGYMLYMVCFLVMICYLFLMNLLFTKKYFKSLIGL